MDRFLSIKYGDWIVAFFLIITTYLIGFNVGQSDFRFIIIFYSFFFAAYLYVIKFRNIDKIGTLKFYLAIAVLLRFILLFSFPNLSNDVYRFIWDGRLLAQGWNPFDHLPEYYLQVGNEVPGITKELFQAYGEKNFFTVYPPIAQAQFVSSCWLFPENIYWSAVVMKGWLFFFEIGSIFLLPKILKELNLSKWNTLLYALNPLVIIEVMGNLHFEGAMVFFLLLAYYLTLKNKNNWSAVALALSVCSKLLTILFLPFLLHHLGWKKFIKYTLIFSFTTVLLFVPILNQEFLFNFGDSLNLYFQKLEFNASIYYFFRWIGFHITGYNQIKILGPLLGLAAGVSILWLAFIQYKRQFNRLIESMDLKQAWCAFPKYCLFAISIYLVSTTTMHPWYTILPIILCVFTSYRFPIVWSYLIFWTYVNYSYDPYRENLFVVGIEYLIVFCWFFWEYRRNKEKVLSL